MARLTTIAAGSGPWRNLQQHRAQCH